MVVVAVQPWDITGSTTQLRALHYILQYLNQIPMPESISKPKDKVSWVEVVNGAGWDMQRSGATDAFYAQEFRKTDLCLGNHNSSRAWD